jgi:hypothetical protein
MIGLTTVFVYLGLTTLENKLFITLVSHSYSATGSGGLQDKHQHGGTKAGVWHQQRKTTFQQGPEDYRTGLSTGTRMQESGISNRVQRTTGQASARGHECRSLASTKEDNMFRVSLRVPLGLNRQAEVRFGSGTGLLPGTAKTP